MGALLLVMWAAGVATLSGAVLVWAWRGRRVDGHPLCRACGFDLTGRPETSVRCAECGADVTRPGAVRTGHRVRRWGWMITAGYLLVCSTYSAWIVMPQGAEWNRYKPASWLARDLQSSDSSIRQADLSEFSQRFFNQPYATAADFRSVADIVLAAQADTSTPWYLEMGDLIVLMHRLGLLDHDRWIRFGRNGAKVELWAPRVQDPDKPTRVSITVSTLRASSSESHQAQLRFFAEFQGGLKWSTGRVLLPVMGVSENGVLGVQLLDFKPSSGGANTSGGVQPVRYRVEYDLLDLRPRKGWNVPIYSSVEEITPAGEVPRRPAMR